jgi:glutathione peroxidase
VAVAAAVASATAADKGDQKVPDVLNFKMKSLDGKEVDLAKYQGKVVLIVNVASRCGNTPQYKDLQALHEKYSKDGLVILGFPCNQFGKQEPGNNEQIAEFCTKNYGVTFPLFDKIEVNGAGAAPLYKFLTSEVTNPKHAGPVKWNFQKYLIGRDGEVKARIEHRTKPSAPEVVQQIEAELKK